MFQGKAWCILQQSWGFNYRLDLILRRISKGLIVPYKDWYLIVSYNVWLVLDSTLNQSDFTFISCAKIILIYWFLPIHHHFINFLPVFFIAFPLFVLLIVEDIILKSNSSLLYLFLTLIIFLDTRFLSDNLLSSSSSSRVLDIVAQILVIYRRIAN